jgi:arylsulfatase A-like enzyme
MRVRISYQPAVSHFSGRSTVLLVVSVITLLASLACQASADPPTSRDTESPNVLLLIIDDHAANMVSVMGSSAVKTPYIERLATRGVWFKHAYNPAPVCAASRAAFLTGIHPANSGVYFNSHAYRRTDSPIASAVTLHGHFLKHGYLVAGYGKINHTGYQEDNLSDFSPGYFNGHNLKKYVTHDDSDLLDHVIPGMLRRLTGVPGAPFGPLPNDWDLDDPNKMQQDTEQANLGINFLSQAHDKPFFLTVGFWRPHSAYIVPKRYFDLYPLEDFSLPPGYLAGDLEDVPGPGRYLAARSGRHGMVTAAGLWREHIQAKAASTSYIDEQIGRVTDALNNSPYADNTIVVLISDNGFHVGEKEHWSKYALWEQTNRVLFSISGPSTAPRTETHPVGLIDLYPTLVSMAIPATSPTHALDGVDISKLVKGDRSDLRPPVVSTYGPGNHSVRDCRYRYIRYWNGDEELYDHSIDPYEWKNLASTSEYDEVKIRMTQWLPSYDAPEVAPARPYDGSEMTEAVYRHWEPEWNRTRPFRELAPSMIFQP